MNAFEVDPWLTNGSSGCLIKLCGYHSPQHVNLIVNYINQYADVVTVISTAKGHGGIT